MKNLEQAIFELKTLADFEQIALEVFNYQYTNNKVYADYLDLLGRPRPLKSTDIPFLPISFFKSHDIRTSHKTPETLFMSSGTTGMIRSTHAIEKTSMYERSFLPIYEAQVGDPCEQVILALLPNYLEQGNSSLVYMVDHLIKVSANPLSGFYLDNPDELLQAYEKGLQAGKKVILFGVSYALLDLADFKPDLSKATIIETGGMKGRRKELTKEELHEILKEAFQVPYISSEYGMTELLSQAYSNKDGLFDLPRWMDVRIRDVNDPFAWLEDGKTGGINVIDLANLYSCAFIATQDLGKRLGAQFQWMGRFDQADIRGCNLLVG
jgi:hypothetical protein